MPEFGAHAHSHQKTIAGVAGIAETENVRALSIVAQELFVVFEPTRGKYNAAARPDAQFLALMKCDNADDFTFAGNKLLCGRAIADPLRHAPLRIC